MINKELKNRSLSNFRSYFEIFKTFSFLKLFLSLLFLIIFPFAIFITHFLYRDYNNTLDWNYRFQLTRVQLMSIDIENHIRDHLLTQAKEKTHFWNGNLESLKENNIFNVCLKNENDIEFFKRQKTFFFPCSFENAPKNWILLYDNGMVWIYSADFLEDHLLDSPFSEPSESIFLVNQDSKFGISSQIETNFRIPTEWISVLGTHTEQEQSLPKIRDIQLEGKGFFLSSFPMYGLPFHLFVISPKEILLEPVRINLVRNLLFLSLFFVVTLILSAWISGREMEDKRKLNIIFREFPHAALLYDSDGEVLLSNPNLESKISIYTLATSGQNVLQKINAEAKSFLKQVSQNSNVFANTRIEEWEAITMDGDLIYLEIALHLWFLENNQTTPRGTLILIQDITSKKLEFQTEMVYAKQLQKKYLPSEKISIPGLHFENIYMPLLQVGGDYYDFLNLGNNKYIFVLGDIVGHGVQAAMMMTVVRVLFHQIVKETTVPGEILLKMNEGVRTNLPDSYSFVPFQFLLFDFNISKIFYGNAGHPGVVHITENDAVDIPERLNPMLGILPTFSPKIKEIKLSKGDRFFLFTDGLSDVRNNRNEQLGNDELVTFFISSKTNPIIQIKETLIEMVKNHSQGASYPDDITWIGIEII